MTSSNGLILSKLLYKCNTLILVQQPVKYLALVHHVTEYWILIGYTHGYYLQQCPGKRALLKWREIERECIVTSPLHDVIITLRFDQDVKMADRLLCAGMEANVAFLQKTVHSFSILIYFQSS
ncbi:hypothetical protein FGO68_gene3704 [Halteria grandinella]|uniref:Uncharacterized protein n=1 Tax=Halteria grandinella TaxID=5974 RepID=A0A8J8N8U6_HALGN|nr:hypothetical protein FGO68_gene3704 [Halteria grandinella]